MAFMGAIKENNSVYLVKEAPLIYDTETMFDEDNLEVFKPKGNQNVVIACASDVYKGQIVKDIEHFISPREEGHGITKRYLMQSVLPKLVHEYQEIRVLKKGKISGENYGLAIAIKDKCYYIGGSFTVREIGDVEFFNFANPFMRAAFDELGDMPVMDKLKIATAQFDNLYNPIHFPLIIKNTMSDETIFISRKEAYLALEEHLKGGK